METGVNHRGFISSYSPIGDDEKGHYLAAPEYYGMLAFTLAGKGPLLKAEMDAGAPLVKAYATEPRQGAVAVTAINKGPEQSALAVNLGSGIKSRTASLLRLRGPAIEAKTGITLGGTEVTASGVWKPAKPEVVTVPNGQFRVELPAGSAAIVEILRIPYSEVSTTLAQPSCEMALGHHRLSSQAPAVDLPTRSRENARAGTERVLIFGHALPW